MEERYISITYPVERYKGTAKVTIHGMDSFGVTNVDGPWTINGVKVEGTAYIVEDKPAHATVLRHDDWKVATESAYDKFLLVALDLVGHIKESRPYLIVEAETRRLKRNLETLEREQDSALSKLKSINHAITDTRLAIAGQGVKYQQAVEAHVKYMGALPASEADNG